MSECRASKQTKTIKSNAMKCPRCQTNNLRIEQAPDSFAKQVFCSACQFKQWLKYFNKKTKNICQGNF